MQTEVRKPTRIKLGNTKLQKKAGAYILKTPLMAQCWKCKQYKLAMVEDRPSGIAAMPAGNHHQTHFKWFCPKCARDFGIQPTQELMKKLPTMNTLHVRYRKTEVGLRISFY